MNSWTHDLNLFVFEMIHMYSEPVNEIILWIDIIILSKPVKNQ